jgi:hypothetical protein
VGSCILVRFTSLALLVGSYPHLTSATLKDVAAVRVVPISDRWLKRRITDELCAHVCSTHCSSRLVHVFRERVTSRGARRQRCRAAPSTVSASVVYHFVDSPDSRMWESGGVHFVTSNILMTEYRMQPDGQTSLQVVVPLSTLLLISTALRALSGNERSSIGGLAIGTRAR